VAATLLLAIAVVATLVVVRHHRSFARGKTVRFRACTLADRVPARCGRLLVRENRDDPHSRWIALHVAVIPATKQPAVGALFYLEGGPGGAATDAAKFVNETFAKVNQHRDLVLVDQRGTGGSHRLTCPQEHMLVSDVAAVTDYVRRCFARFHADVRSYTTAAAADDLDVVRRALDYRRIDLYGGSYGATLAQVYLERHGDSVRTAILDGGSLADVPLYELSAENAERALRLDLARCRAQAACRRDYPRSGAELATLLSRPPRRVVVAGRPPVVLDSGAVASTIQALSQSADGVARIPFLVHEAAAGNYADLAAEYSMRVGAQLDDRARLAMFWVIQCSEPWARFGVAATAQESRGSYFGPVAVAHARLFHSACRAVPKAQLAGDPVRSFHVPTLVLAGAADPQDPAANMKGWRRVFPDGRLVVVPGAAHGAIASGCLPLVAAAFVARGTADDLDTACAEAVRPPPFELR
jgi:pimeloyl-ACP methyl ester carboxylesterase